MKQQVFALYSRLARTEMI